MPAYRYEVHACTECSGQIARGRLVLMGFSPRQRPKAGESYRLSCEHILAREKAAAK